MVGFTGILKDDHQSKFTFILAESGPSIHRLEYLTTLLRNHSESFTNYVHLASFVFKNMSSSLKFDNIKYYDFIKDSFPTLGEFYTDLKKNINPSKRNILIVDDLALFYIYNERASKDIARFFQQLSKCFCQVILFANLDTLTKEEISLLCSLTETFVVLKNSDSDNTQEFICSQLIMKPSGKTFLDQSYFEVRNGEIKESLRRVDSATLATQKDNSAEDIMRSLTTFKLTIEEDEKESKNRLYLPYLDAQRITVPDPSEDFYDDDDEDDDD